MTHSFSKLLLRICAGAALLHSLPAAAEDNFFQVIETGNAASPTSADSRWDSKAYLLQTLKYAWQSPPDDGGFERSDAGISQVKTTLFWQGQGALTDSLDWQLSARGENEWYFWEANEPRWKSHNSGLRLRDAFVDFTRDKFWLRAGQQILAWGQSEGLVITDVLSPRDLREPGQAELQDIREPVPALLNAFSIGSATKLNLVITYAADSNRYADAQEPFDFFARYRGEGLEVVERDPATEWEFALKLDHTFNGGDISLVAARTNDKSLALVDLDVLTGTLTLGQQRQTVIGGTVGWVQGNWLLKTELAHWQDVPLITLDYGAWPLHDQTRAMTGVEYSGWDKLRLSFEVNAVRTESHSDRIAADASDAGFAAHLRHTAFNERLIQQVRILKLASEDAYIGRWEMSLDWSDAWTFSCGLTAYRVSRESSLFYPLRHHDSASLSAKYSF